MSTEHKNMERCLFTNSFGDPLDCTTSADQRVIDALKIAERAVNVAIADNAERIELRYINIPDAETNPDGAVGGVRVVGYRSTKPKDRFVYHILSDVGIEKTFYAENDEEAEDILFRDKKLPTNIQLSLCRRNDDDSFTTVTTMMRISSQTPKV